MSSCTIISSTSHNSDEGLREGKCDISKQDDVTHYDQDKFGVEGLRTKMTHKKEEMTKVMTKSLVSLKYTR